MNTSYEAWARFDVDKELEHVDAVEQQEQQRKQHQKKVAEKRSVEDSISRDAEQSADALAAHAAVAALKAKKGRGRGRSGVKEERGVDAGDLGDLGAEQEGGAKTKVSDNADAETLSRVAEMMKQKHTLIAETMLARRRGDKLMEAEEWDESYKEYERALVNAKALEELKPQLVELQELQALILGRTPVKKPETEPHDHSNQCEKEPHNHEHSHDHDHSHDCHSANDARSAKAEKVKRPTPQPLPKAEDLGAVVKMFLKDCYLGIGACEMGKHHYAAASEKFKEVLLRDDNHLASWLQRGKCFENMDAPLLAWLHFNRVTSQDADFEEAKECETRIKSVLLEPNLRSSDCAAVQSLVAAMSLKEILSHVKLHMDAGNVIMIEGFHEYAVLKYESALHFLAAARASASSAPTTHEPSVTKVVSHLEISCHVNIASCLLEMQKHFSRALKHCQHALEIDPGHVVANFRIGQAYRALHDYESALLAFHTVRMLLSYLPAERAQEQLLKLDKEVDRCEFDRSQYDAAYIRQQMKQDAVC